MEVFRLRGKPMLEVIQLVLAAVVHAVLVVALAWDLYVMYAGHGEATVSRAVYEWSQRTPALLLLLGVAIGHLFLPLQIRK